MKKKLLCCALLAGVGMTHSAAAQTYDDRWYFGAGAGVGFFDDDRNAEHELYGVIGLGKMISPRVSIDAELWHSNPELDNDDLPSSLSDVERNWELMSLSIVGRYHFPAEGRSATPYLMLGIGAQEHHDGTIVFPPGLNESRTGVDVVVLAGAGVTWDIGYPYLRGEIGARIDTDDGGPWNEDDDDSYVDAYVGLELLFPIGPEAVPAPPPAPAPMPPAKTCADLDDDGDGVNNCDDKCPGSPAGSAVGVDGCPVPPPVEEPKPYRG